MKFKGTPREAGWRRCGQMSEPDGIYFTPWPHEEYPTWSVPALETAKCVAKQGDEAFDRLHLRPYAAAVTEHGVQAIPVVVVVETGRSLVGLADLATYRAAVQEAQA